MAATGRYDDSSALREFTEETTFVVGSRTFRVRVTTNEVALVAKVTVTMDGRFQWTFDEPSWLPLSFGACLDIAYLWSARALIVLPAFDVKPEKIEVDEDLLFVFHVDEGWVLVCETSARRWVHGSETARLEFGEVITHAAWVRDLLVLRDLSGAEAWVRVEGNQFSL